MKIQKMQLVMLVLVIGLLSAGCSTGPVPKNTDNAMTETKETDSGHVAAEDEMAAPKEVVEEGMVPVYGNELKDGTYSVNADSSSSMFKIIKCRLTVSDGTMNAVMTMSGTGYLKLYMGTGVEASAADEKDYIPYVETQEGEHTFEVPVEALDMGIDCSAFSKRKEKWYDRVLVFRSDSLPADAFADGKIKTAQSLNLEDGTYTAQVTLEGGSGKASVKSPTELLVEDGKVFASIIWSSSNYDYMKVNDEKFQCEIKDGNSAFEIPVSGFDWKIPVIANTTAMSEPHEIEYTLAFDSTSLIKVQ